MLVANFSWVFKGHFYPRCHWPVNLVVPAWPEWLFAVTVSDHIVPVAAKPSSSCCWVVSLPHNVVCICWELFSLKLPRRLTFCAIWWDSQWSKFGKPSPAITLAFGKVCRVRAGLEAMQSGCGVFCRGVGCRMWLLLGWPSQALWLGLALTPPAADPKLPGSLASWYSQPSRKLCKAHKSSAGE